MSLLHYLAKDIKIYLVIGLLSIWCLSTSALLLMRQEKVILLQMNGFDTRALSASENPPVEIENYIHNFVGLFYSYTSKNYEDHMNRATPLFDLQHLRSWGPKVNKMFETVSASYTVQNSFVERIFKIEDFFYELDLKVDRKIAETESSDNYKIRIRLEKDKRTIENPYGLKITSLEEIYE